MRTILGVDPSSKRIAITATCDNDLHKEPRMYIITLPDDVRKAAGEAFQETFEVLMELGRHTVSLYLEDPVLAHNNPHSTIVQARISGAILAAAAQAEVKVFTANNQRWKKIVTGHGNIPKADLPQALASKWRVAYDMAAGDPDLVDSALINRYGVKDQRLRRRIRSFNGYREGEEQEE